MFRMNLTARDRRVLEQQQQQQEQQEQQQERQEQEQQEQSNDRSHKAGVRLPSLGDSTVHHGQTCQVRGWGWPGSALLLKLPWCDVSPVRVQQYELPSVTVRCIHHRRHLGP